MAVNSKEYSFSDINVTFLGRTVTGLRAIKFSVKVDKELLFGRGNKALAIQSGNQTVEGSITLLQSEFEALIAAAKAANPNAKITDISFDVAMSLGQGLQSRSYLILGVEITEYELGFEQEDKFAEIELPFMALDVKELA